MRDAETPPDAEAEKPAQPEKFDPAAAVNDAAGATQQPRCQVDYAGGGQVSVLESYDEVTAKLEQLIDEAVDKVRPSMVSVELTMFDAQGNHTRISIAVGTIVALYEISPERWSAVQQAREAQAQAAREAAARFGGMVVGPGQQQGPPKG